MAVYRQENDENCVLLGNVYLSDRTLSLQAKGLLAVVLSSPDLLNSRAANIGRLMEITGDNEYRVVTTLRKLRDRGYLIRTYRQGKEYSEKQRVNYCFFEMPLQGNQKTCPDES